MLRFTQHDTKIFSAQASDGIDAAPLVSIVIPHLRGREILFRCLEALRVGTGHALSLQIVVVDNASDDGSVQAAQVAFPEIIVLRASKNLGFAGACNWGIRETLSEFIVLLNDDAEVTPGWLEPLLDCMRSDETIAAGQPKLLAIDPRDAFDYAGACGGHLDVFGFPLSRGRIFQTIEKDAGQYDDATDVFWATGACMLLRRSALQMTGLLDEDFFAHMEEIDLCWRLHLAGYRVRVVPASIVRHQSGSTLQQQAPQKVYLNHRNSLTMLLKNYGGLSLLRIFPLRLLFELMAGVYYVAKVDIKSAAAVMRAFCAVLWRLPAILRKRARIQQWRVCSDRALRKRFYRRSIVLDYFVLGRRSFAGLRSKK